MENKSSLKIHVTGVQRSGHNFVANLLSTGLGVCWTRQQRLNWELAVAIRHITSVGKVLKPGITDDLIRLEDTKEDYNRLFAGQHQGDTPPDSASVFGAQVSNIPWVAVTEYREPEWFYKHCDSISHMYDININVVRDPRNVLASACVHPSKWTERDCSKILDGCEFQYNSREINEYINLSYEELIAKLDLAFRDNLRLDSIAGVKLTDWSWPAIRAIAAGSWKNSSFGNEENLKTQFIKFVTRYENPEVLSNPIFKSLIPRANDIYDRYHLPFINSGKKQES